VTEHTEPLSLSLIYPHGENFIDVAEYVQMIHNHLGIFAKSVIDCDSPGCDTPDNLLYQRLAAVFDPDNSDGVIVYPGWENCASSREAVKVAYRARLPIYRIGMTDAGPALLPRVEVVGVCGWAQSGKDTVAGALVEDFGYSKASFADTLRDIVSVLNPIISDTGVRYADSVRDIGYEETKRVYPESRRVLQVLGTEGVREFLDEEAWPLSLYLKIQDGAKVVIPDVRFENEIDFVRYCGGKVWWVSRPEVSAPPFAHATENSISPDHTDNIITNDGTVIDIARKVSALMREDSND